MTERPIMYSGMMVRQVLADLKTKTRRLAKPRRKRNSLLEVFDEAPNGFTWTDSYIKDPGNREWLLQEAPCRPGDTLWVRENFRLPTQFDGHLAINVKENVKIHYEATGEPSEVGSPYGRLRPSIHMPRFRSRITLTCLDVQVERLHEITDEDAIAEGITKENVIVGAHNWGKGHVEETADRFFYPGCPQEGFDDPITAFQHLWEVLHGEGSWAKNPLLWVISFERCPA